MGSSADGSRVFFDTTEALADTDTDAQLDLYERAGGQTTQVSRGNGAQNAGFGGLSLDGGRVFFSSVERLAATDTDDSVDVYRRGGHDRRMRILRHLLAIGLLPGMATLLVPALLVSGDEVAAWPPALLGAALIALGLVLMAQTIALFATAGDGTLAPWDPTSRLVVRGPYRRVRNPMISGVLCILLGEALLFTSTALLAWWALFLAINAIWFPLVEEPGLRRRFGADYEAYRAAVPRWLPRLRPWTREACPPSAPGERRAWRAGR